MTRREYLGEMIGTFILVFFGLGSVAVEVATPVTLGLPAIALIWGAAVALAIQLTGPLSGAHLNPAITIAFATGRGFSWKKVPGYLGAQFVGAILAAVGVYGCFGKAITSFEKQKAIVRGEPGSEASAKIFGEYYECGLLKAMIYEGGGTFLLAFGIFSLIGFTQKRGLEKWLPLMIGAWLAFLIWMIAPTTQAGFNPARDLGPRVISSFMGWKSWVFQANELGWLLVYVVAPVGGAWLASKMKNGS